MLLSENCGNEMKMKKYNELFTVLDKMRSLPASVRNMSTRERINFFVFERVCSLELDAYFQSAEFEKAITSAKEAEKAMAVFGSKFRNSDFGSIIIFNIACLYIVLKKYNEAKKWLNHILERQGESVRTDLYCFAKILYLIVNYEAGKSDLLPYAVRSVYRFLLKRNRIYSFETVILKFLKKVSQKALSEKTMEAEYRKLKAEFVLLSKDKFEKQVFEYFDFLS